jgi:hypothetical protein
MSLTALLFQGVPALFRLFPFKRINWSQTKQVSVTLFVICAFIAVGSSVCKQSLCVEEEYGVGLRNNRRI